MSFVTTPFAASTVKVSPSLFEYEFGISYLKDYHPKAYKDFHRIIGHKENYSHEIERENHKRLKSYE